MGDALGIMYATYAIVGIYMIVIAVRAVKGGEVSSSLLWDREKPIEKCRDREGFVRYLFPRVLFCGIFMLADGIYSYAAAVYEFLPDIGVYSMIPLLAVFILYSYTIRKATERFY